jgi:hypothetical protein
VRHFWKELAYAAIAKLIVGDRERTIKIIDEFIANTDYPEVESTLEHLKDAIKGQQNGN